MERRTFLKSTLVGVGALKSALAGTNAFAAAKSVDPDRAGTAAILIPIRELVPPPDGYEPPDWLRSMRAVFFEGTAAPVYPHLDDFDADRVVRIVQELGGDTLRFEPVTLWATFPTKSGFPIHPELGNRDLLAEVVRACRKAGLRLYCYCKYNNPFLAVDYIRQHPEYLDWVARRPDGTFAGTYDLGGWIISPLADATGDAYRGAIHQIVEEYSTYDIDGAYFDAPSAFGYTAFCYCETCRKKFQAYCGMDIDRLRNPDDMAAITTWYRWFGEMELADLLAFRKTLHGRGKFMLCHNGATWMPQALRQQYRIPEGFMLEHQVQVYRRLAAGLMGSAMARPTKKLSQMYVGSYALSAPPPPHNRRKPVEDTSEEDGDEVLMEGVATLASGSTPIYATVNRLYYGLGQGSAQPAKEVYAIARRTESLAKDSVIVPYVTVIPSWEALQLWRTRRRGWNVEMGESFALAMLDARLNFDVCPSTEVTADWLRHQRVIALCGASGVSDEFARLLADWVEQGGALLATYDTGLYDGNGRMRPGGALKEVLGVEIMGDAPDSQPECYYRIHETHPALGEYRAGSVIKGDGELVPVRAVGNAKVLADAWNLAARRTLGPAIVVNQFGRGRTVYIGGSLEAHYAASRLRSHLHLLGSVVRYLAGDSLPPFTLEAPRGVYGVLRRAPNGDLTLWVLANVGFKDADIGRMRQEFTPVPEVEVGILVPEGRTAKAAHLMRAGRTVPFSVENGYARMKLSAMHIAEIVHLELG